MPNTDTDPNAPENLPPLNRFTDSALLADFAHEIERGATQGDVEWSPTAMAYQAEILRRMNRGGRR